MDRRAQRVDVLGVGVDALGVDELHRELVRLVAERRHAIVAHVNVHGLNLVRREPWLREFWRAADVVFCDGAGVALGARLLGRRLPERITYADWAWQLAGLAERERFRLFLLGGRPGVAAAAAERLRERFPALEIAGTHHGYFDKSPGGAPSRAVLAEIEAAAPHLLLVGFGMPLQERWLLDHWPEARAEVALTVGAAFDYVSGELRRAPRLLTGHGFEWLGRLLIEPRRLWRRYLLGNPAFLLRVLRQRLFG